MRVPLVPLRPVPALVLLLLLLLVQQQQHLLLLGARAKLVAQCEMSASVCRLLAMEALATGPGPRDGLMTSLPP